MKELIFPIGSIILFVITYFLCKYCFSKSLPGNKSQDANSSLKSPNPAESGTGKEEI